MHVPGHSDRGSGAVVVGATVDVIGRRVDWGLCFVVLTARVLSQHTDPCLQLDVREISTEGRSQNAAIMLSKQNPGHRGAAAVVGGWYVVGRRVVDTTFLLLSLVSAPLVIQQLPSSGQNASLSMPSQKSAIRSPTHSPRHFFFCSKWLVLCGCDCFDGPDGYRVGGEGVLRRLGSVEVLATVVGYH